MASRDKIAAAAAAEDAAAKTLDALGLAPAEALRRIALADCRVLPGRLIDTDAMVPAGEALQALAEMVRAEDRRDLRGRICMLSMRADGLLCQLDRRQLGLDAGDQGYWAAGLQLTRHALLQIAGRMPRRPSHAGPYWASIPTERRAAEFNSSNQANGSGRAASYELTLRSGLSAQTGERTIYAAVSDRYTAYDPDRLAADVLAALGSDAKTIRSEVVYNGLTTQIRLLVRDLNGFGVMGLVSTADDGTAACSVSAELRLPSGASYGGTTAAQARRFRHIGHERTTAQIKEALEQVADACEPWVQLWKTADAAQLPGDIMAAIDTLTSGRRPWLRGRGEISSAALAAHLRLALQQQAEGKLPGFRVRHTQAGLAELMLVAARLGNLPERADLLQDAGERIMRLSASAFAALFAVQAEADVAAENQDLNNRLGTLSAKLAGRWEALAEEAEDEGDQASAAIARERAQIIAVTGDAQQMLNDKKTAAKLAKKEKIAKLATGPDFEW